MATGSEQRLTRPGAYAPLAVYLTSYTEDELTLSFAAIEQILGCPLPRSAYTQRWWGSSKQGIIRRDLQTAGWVVRSQNVRARTVTFARRAEATTDTEQESNQSPTAS